MVTKLLFEKHRQNEEQQKRREMEVEFAADDDAGSPHGFSTPAGGHLSGGSHSVFPMQS